MYDVRGTRYDVLVSARCATMRSGSEAEFLKQPADLAGMRRSRLLTLHCYTSRQVVNGLFRY